MTEEQAKYQIVPYDGNLFMDVAMFEHVQRVAKVFAASSMVPAHFQNNIGNCCIAINLAARMKCDPFMLMQNMYIVHGRPGIESKLAIALVNNFGRFTPIQYRWSDDKTGCTAYATDTKSGEVCEGVTVTLKMAADEGWTSKAGSKWKTMPQLMLQYRSAMFFARAYCPEALLGMSTREELYDIDMKEVAPGSFAPESTDDLEKRIVNGTGEFKPGIQAETIPDEPPKAWWHRDNWFAMRGGYRRWINQNLERIWKEADDSTISEMNDKFQRMYNEPMPTVKEKVNGAVTRETISTAEKPVEMPPESVKIRELNRELSEEYPQEWEAARIYLNFPDAIVVLSDDDVKMWNDKISKLVDVQNLGK